MQNKLAGRLGMYIPVVPQIKDPKYTCLTCYWFQFVPGHKPRTRACTYPGSLKFKDGRCLMWKPAYSLRDRILAALKLKKLPRRGLVY